MGTKHTVEYRPDPAMAQQLQAQREMLAEMKRNKDAERDRFQQQLEAQAKLSEDLKAIQVKADNERAQHMQEINKMQEQGIQLRQQMQEEQKQAAIEHKKEMKLRTEQITNEFKVQQEGLKKEMDKMEESHKKTFLKTKIDAGKQRILDLQRLCQAKEDQKQKKTTELLKCEEELQVIQKEHNEEAQHLQTFETEDLNGSVFRVVLLGKTGTGKSTYANRMYGDKSDEGNEGPFSTSSSEHSETNQIQRVMTKIGKQTLSLVDTPGIFDSNNKDRFYANDLVEYLRGCGGVNAFLIFRNYAEPRFDESTQSMYRSIEKLMGKDFWKHVIIIATRVDSERMLRKFEQTKKDEMETIIMETFNLNNIKNIPIIATGDDPDIYEKSMVDLVNTIPPERYMCDKLKSHIEELETELNRQLLIVNDLKNQIQDIETEQNEYQTEITQIQQAIAQYENEI